MAIWAIANIVREMSEPTDSTIAESNAHVAAAVAKDPPPGTSDQHNNHRSVCRSQESALPRQDVDTNVATPSPTLLKQKPMKPNSTAPIANASPCTVEADFPFEEIQNLDPLATFGNKPPTETLEIEIGSVDMQSTEASQLQDGIVVALQQTVDDQVLVRHHDRVVATGKMTVVDGKLAVRISERID